MKKYRDLLTQCIEIQRLLQITGFTLEDGLDLMLDHLRLFAEHDEQNEDKQHADFPLWLYGQQA